VNIEEMESPHSVALVQVIEAEQTPLAVITPKRKAKDVEQGKFE